MIYFPTLKEISLTAPPTLPPKSGHLNRELPEIKQILVQSLKFIKNGRNNLQKEKVTLLVSLGGEVQPVM